MIVVMPKLNGSKVRHRVAELDLDLRRLSALTDIPEGTLKNATRDGDPQPIKLSRIYKLLRALNQPGHNPLAFGDLLASGDGVPDEPPSKEQEQESNTGPGRGNGGGTGPGKDGKKAPKRLKDAVGRAVA